MHYGIYPKSAPGTAVASDARRTIARSSPRGVRAYINPVATSSSPPRGLPSLATRVFRFPKAPAWGNFNPTVEPLFRAPQTPWVTCAPLAARNHAHHYLAVVTTDKTVYSHGLHFVGCQGLCSPFLHMIFKTTNDLQ